MTPSRTAAASLAFVARVALLSILLGLAVQAAVVALLLWERAPLAAAAAQVAGGVSWAVLVCTGVAVGTMASRGRPMLGGLTAAAVAPLSLAVAKGAQKAMGGWLAAAQSEAVLSLGAASLIRAVEYGVLGWLLGRLVARGDDRAEPFLAAGAGVGVLFGGAVTVLTWRAALVAGTPLGDPRLAVLVVNEVVFPMGCALVILLGQQVGRSLSLLDPGGAQPAA